MSYELRRQIEALRAPLRVAAADGFAALAMLREEGQLPRFSESLRSACDRVMPLVGGRDAEAFRSWRGVLAAFERLDGDRQAVEVARGLRLCQTVGGAASERSAPPAVSAAPAVAAPAVKSTTKAGAGTAKVATAAASKSAASKSAASKAEAAPAASASPLAAPITTLPGIGPALAERLAERGLVSVEDLVWLVPRRYDDVRVQAPLATALDGVLGERVTASGVVAGCRFFRFGQRRWVELRLVDVADPTAVLVIRWFNAYGPMDRRFPDGAEVLVSGRLERRGKAFEMANPDVLSVRTPDGKVTEAPARIIPRYADVPGVPPATLRKACAAAVARAGAILDGVPASVAARLGLGGLADALARLHAPATPDEPSIDEIAELNRGNSPWHRRLAFDELFVLGLAVAQRRRLRRSDVAVPCPDAGQCDAELAAALPFALTGAQRRGIVDLRRDLGRDQPMNRLLQGDVGAGKTAVAFAAIHQVVRAGRQAALMAPTEILAEQHARTLEPWCRRLGMRVALLTASTPRGVRASTLALLAAGELDVVVGTHALLAEGVVLPRLGVAIVDEQHRFGVAQRVRLRDKSDDGAPHLLVMTATPIPRTLALTGYGDLDVTVLDELPPGRLPVQTQVLAGARGRDRAYALLAKRVAAGERGFVVCPLVEPTPPSESASSGDDARRGWRDAVSTAAELTARLAPARVGLVHGRLAQPDRDQAMTAFRDGASDVLVATTVIEVGVDVPQATVMIIEDAHHFGLAQLHQLRGRVGRGGGAAHCLLLMSGGKTDDGARRLAVMAETTDGFRIAEEDLAMRGPGELLGARQAGLPKLRFGDLTQHIELLLLARAEADRLLDADPELSRPEHAATRQVLEERLAAAGITAYGAESG